jgi:hypothetical protein
MELLLFLLLVLLVDLAADPLGGLTAEKAEIVLHGNERRDLPLTVRTR